MASQKSVQISFAPQSNPNILSVQIADYIKSNQIVETLQGDISLSLSPAPLNLTILVQDSSSLDIDPSFQPSNTLVILRSDSSASASLVSLAHRVLSQRGYQVRSLAQPSTANEGSGSLSHEQLALVLSDIHSFVHLMLEDDPARILRLRDLWRVSSTFSDLAGMRFAEAGCLKRSKEDVAQVFEAFPVALTHARLSKEMYQRARLATKVQNEIWMKMAFDLPFLLKQTEQLAKEDDFVAEFVKIVQKKAQLPPNDAPDFRFAISRNDYMIEPDSNFYQVEFNLIASSLGPISQRHRLALQAIDRDFETTDKSLTPVDEDNEKFLADSLAAAHAAYGVPEAIIVLVCAQEKNVFDQWCPSRRLAIQGIKFERFSFTELRKILEVDEATKKASVFGKEVAIFYLRDGYMPHQYEPEDWKVREKFELSNAIKCPDATLQLINMKYFQLVLNRQSTWSHFGYSEEEFKQNERTFCKILTIDDFEGNKEKMKEFIHKEGGVKNWVLKPQREGGANNFFDEDIITQIDTQHLQELKSFILMEKIFARKRAGVITNWKDGVKVRPLIDEIGMFQSNIFVNQQSRTVIEGGTLVRSKVAGVNEGGVGMGFAVINSIAFE
jgi:glutathione synthase